MAAWEDGGDPSSAGRQVAPPSALTSTEVTAPPPDQAVPAISTGAPAARTSPSAGRPISARTRRRPTAAPSGVPASPRKR